ncbi:MAG: asparaginase, partial [Arthrobacter sp.]|nr:asparaginase [Arthrobacter sp.]
MPSPAMPASPPLTTPASATQAEREAAASAARLPRHEPLAVQTRDGLVESIHYGSLIATAADGRVLFAA